jgi:hypothetical protein
MPWPKEMMRGPPFSFAMSASMDISFIEEISIFWARLEIFFVLAFLDFAKDDLIMAVIFTKLLNR